MFSKEYIDKAKDDPLHFMVGMAVLLLAVMGTSVQHVASAMFAIIVLLSITSFRSWRETYQRLSLLEKFFLLSFVLYAVSGALAYYNTDDADKYFKILERYLRFFLLIPVYLFLVKRKDGLMDYLFAGAVISGPFLLAVALRHYLENPDVPAQGYYHHIIFGQLAVLNIGIMLSLLLTRKLSGKYQVIVVAAMICGIGTAILSQARGVWLVLPFYVLIAAYYAIREKRIGVSSVAAFFLVIIVLLLLTPMGGVIKQRTHDAVTEISHFYTKDQYISSVGTRLAMWDIAFDVWQRHPWLGTGPGDFDDEIISLQEKGEYVGMDVHNSVHNIYIQALVGSGMVGLVALLFTVIVMPLNMFRRLMRMDRSAGLAGFMLVLSFAIFGISESWILRLPAVSVFLIYLSVIASRMGQAR